MGLEAQGLHHGRRGVGSQQSDDTLSGEYNIDIDQAKWLGEFICKPS